MEIKSYLDNLKVKYKVHKHLPVYTCEESDKLKVTINGMHAKSLLVKGKITKNFYMVIIPCKEKPKIIVDYREKNSMIPAELISNGCEIEFQNLSVGDYVVENTAIERKT